MRLLLSAEPFNAAAFSRKPQALWMSSRTQGAVPSFSVPSLAGLCGHRRLFRFHNAPSKRMSRPKVSSFRRSAAQKKPVPLELTYRDGLKIQSAVPPLLLRPCRNRSLQRDNVRQTLRSGGGTFGCCLPSVLSAAARNLLMRRCIPHVRLHSEGQLHYRAPAVVCQEAERQVL